MSVSGEAALGLTDEGMPNSERLDRVVSDEEVFADAIQEHLARGLSEYDRIVHTRGNARLYSVRSDQGPVQQHIQHAAMHLFIQEKGLSERFYTQSEYSPFTITDFSDPSDADVWCVEITPDGSEIRLNYKYSPGKQGEGWEFCLLAIHRQARSQVVPRPKQVLAMRKRFEKEPGHTPTAKKNRPRKK